MSATAREPTFPGRRSPGRATQTNRNTGSATTVTRRIATLWTWLGLLGAAHARAQEGGAPAWMRPLHHGEQPPDYVVAVLTPPVRAIFTPPPPVEAPHYLRLHHAPHMPDYLAAIQPRSAYAIAIPPAPKGEAPAVVRGVYLNGWVFGSSRFYNLLALADTTEINAFVIDVKDATGYLTYRSSVPTAQQIGANDVVRIADPRARLAQLVAHGIHPIARIVVARDPLLAKRKGRRVIDRQDLQLALFGEDPSGDER